METDFITVKMKAPIFFNFLLTFDHDYSPHAVLVKSSSHSSLTSLSHHIASKKTHSSWCFLIRGNCIVCKIAQLPSQKRETGNFQICSLMLKCDVVFLSTPQFHALISLFPDYAKQRDGNSVICSFDGDGGKLDFLRKLAGKPWRLH